MRTLIFLLTTTALFAADPRIGTWKAVSGNVMQDPPETVTVTTEAGGVRYKYSTGMDWTAKPDESLYPIKGSAQSSQVAMRRIAQDTVELTYKRSARPDVLYRVEVTEGGRIMTFTRKGIHEVTVLRRIGGAPDSTRPFDGEWAYDLNESVRRDPPVWTYSPDGANGVHSHWEGWNGGVDYRRSWMANRTPFKTHATISFR